MKKRSFLTSVLSVLLLVCMLFATACGGGDNTEVQKVAPAEIVCNGAPEDLVVGESAQLWLFLRYNVNEGEQAELDTNVVFTWECSDGDVSFNFQQTKVNSFNYNEVEVEFMVEAFGGGNATVTAALGGASCTFDIFVLAEGEHRCEFGFSRLENEVEATCGVEGSYDEVYYCAICEEEMQRTTYTSEALEHEAKEFPEEENVVASTCQEYGSYDEVYYCRHCDGEISREHKDYTSLGDHTIGDAEERYVTLPTCTTGGTMATVYPCIHCGETCWSTGEYMVAALHTMDNGTCTLCGAVESTQGIQVEVYYPNDAGVEYEVVFLGTCTEEEVIIDTYEGHPITRIASLGENSYVKTLTLGKSVTRVEENAVAECDQLEKIEFLGKVEYLCEIAKRVNRDEEYTLDIYVPDLNDWLTMSTQVGSSLWEPIGVNYNLYVNQTKVTELVIPAECTTVPENRFSSCVSLETLILSEGVTEIGSFAFGYCFNLTSASFPSTLVEISGGSFAFAPLQEIALPEGVTVGDIAFEYNQSIQSLTLPNSATISLFAFSDAIIENVYVSNLVAWCESYGNIGRYANNLYVNGTLAEKIEVPTGAQSVTSYAFSFTHIQSVTLSEGVEVISNRAFENATGLLSVTLPNTLTTIGDLAFSGCEALSSIDIPDSVTSLAGEGYTFAGCENLKTVKIGKGLKEIPMYAFGGCKSLSELTIGENVETIGYGAFNNCALTSLTIPDNVVTIETSAFAANPLTSLKLGNKLQTIGYGAFESCNITELIIPDNVTKIESRAFATCRQLTSVKFGSGLEYIGTQAFYGCTVLTSADFGTNVDGWYAIQENSSENNGTPLTSSVVQSATAMASNLTSNGYMNYYFKRN